MHWMRKPRLNRAVATVAVETVFSLLRVVSLSWVIIDPFERSFRGARSASPVSRGSGVDASHRPGTTSKSLVDGRLADGCAEGGFEKVEVAAFIGLLDVAREHPAIAAREATLRLLPFGAAFGKLGLGDIEVDGARGDIERDAVAVLHQRERTAD